MEVFEEVGLDNIEDFSLPHPDRTMMVVPGVGGTISASRIQWSWLCCSSYKDNDDKYQGKGQHASSRFSLQHECGNPSMSRDMGYWHKQIT